MQRFCSQLAWLVAIAWIAPHQAAAEILPTYSTRRLVIESDDIVVAEPLDGGPNQLPLKYKVNEVVTGQAYAVGDEIRIGGEPLPKLDPHPFGAGRRGGKRPDSLIVKSAVLFLLHPSDVRQPLPGGAVRADIRAVSDAGDLLIPRQVMNPGPLYLLPEPDLTMDQLLAEIRSDIPEIQKVRGLLAIENAQERNAGLLAWIDAHKDEFGGGHWFGSKKGWATYETKLFEAIYQSGLPEDCWRAVALSTAFHGRAWVFPSRPFCSPEGRKILLTNALDEQNGAALRLQALKLLSESCAGPAGRPDSQPIAATGDECAEIIHQILPRLRDGKEGWRGAAVNCLLAAVSSGGEATSKLGKEHVLPELGKLHLEERHSYVREQLAKAILRLGGEDYWQELTGNPDGIAAVISLASYDQEKVTFRLSVSPYQVVLVQPISLQLERLDDQGQVTKTIKLVPEIENYTRETQGSQKITQGGGLLAVPARMVANGLWRVSAAGQTEGGKSWNSGPTDLSIPWK